MEGVVEGSTIWILEGSRLVGIALGCMECTIEGVKLLIIKGSRLGIVLGSIECSNVEEG
jgi:hypothetical protein